MHRCGCINFSKVGVNSSGAFPGSTRGASSAGTDHATVKIATPLVLIPGKINLHFDSFGTSATGRHHGSRFNEEQLAFATDGRVFLFFCQDATTIIVHTPKA